MTHSNSDCDRSPTVFTTLSVPTVAHAALVLLVAASSQILAPRSATCSLRQEELMGCSSIGCDPPATTSTTHTIITAHSISIFSFSAKHSRSVETSGRSECLQSYLVSPMSWLVLKYSRFFGHKIAITRRTRTRDSLARCCLLGSRCDPRNRVGFLPAPCALWLVWPCERWTTERSLDALSRSDRGRNACVKGNLHHSRRLLSPGGSREPPMAHLHRINSVACH